MTRTWNANDLLYRQVHPSHAPGGNPSSQAFNPTPKDDGKLSVDDATLVTAADSWSHFTKNLGFQSAGTWAVSSEEIGSAEGLSLTSDPLVCESDTTKGNPAHCLIDFTGLSTKGERKKRAQTLAIMASNRGCQFSPPG